MRAVVQRVSLAKVEVNKRIVGQIGDGLVVYLGVGRNDSQRESLWLSEKVLQLRIFSDDAGKMRHALKEVNGGLLVVSQFTLYGSVTGGRRPDFGEAAPKELAEALYEDFISRCREQGYPVQTGEFGAHMEVYQVNVGPVTIEINTDEVMSHG